MNLPLAALFAGLLSGLTACAVHNQAPPTANRASSGIVTVSANGLERTFNNCKLAVHFSGPSQPKPDPTLTPFLAADLESIDSFSYEANDYGEAATCSCFKSLKPSENTRTLAITTFTQEAAEKDIKVRSTSWNENGQFGKTLDYESSTPSPSGTITFVGRLIYLPRCVFHTIGVVIPAGKLAQATEFRNTTRLPIDATNLAVPEAPKGHYDNDARLMQLKDLFDKSLITREEYDAKRKAILDAL